MVICIGLNTKTPKNIDGAYKAPVFQGKYLCPVSMFDWKNQMKALLEIQQATVMRAIEL